MQIKFVRILSLKIFLFLYSSGKFFITNISNTNQFHLIFTIRRSNKMELAGSDLELKKGDIELENNDTEFEYDTEITE